MVPHSFHSKNGYAIFHCYEYHLGLRSLALKVRARNSVFLCHRKEEGNIRSEFNFSFPGRSKYDEIN